MMRADDKTDSPSFAVRLAQTRQRLSQGIEPQLAELSRLDRKKRSFELAVFVSLWAAGTAITAGGYNLGSGLAGFLSEAMGVGLSAVAINAFMLLMHEGMHHTLFAGRFWNRWAGAALGGTALLSFTAYQVLHTRHHVYLGEAGDPDEYRNYAGRRSMLWVLFYVRLLLGWIIYPFAIPILGWRYGSTIERRRIILEYCLLGVVYTPLLMAVPSGLLLRAWIAPLVIVGYLMGLRGLVQHGLTDRSDPALASRTMRPNPVVAFCLLNENYHMEHHLFPEVPSYNLAGLHKLICTRLPRAVVCNSYLGFIARFLRASRTLDETPIGLKQR